MNKSISRLFLASLAALVLASFAMTPVAEAARGAGVWGGARAGVVAVGRRQSAQMNNSRADVRTNMSATLASTMSTSTGTST